MSQPVSMLNPVHVIQGAGSTVLLPQSGAWGNLFVPVSTAGTVDFYDSATVAGTAAGNLIMGTFPTIQGTPLIWNFNWNVKRGLVAITSGTVNFIVGVA